MEDLIEETIVKFIKYFAQPDDIKYRYREVFKIYTRMWYI